jgi:hypothetical protein
MKTAAADFKSWWDKHEAAYQISKRTGTAFDSTNLLEIALDRGVRFVVNVPTGTKDVQGRAMPGGLWELMIGGKFGKPGRQEIEHEINPNVSVEGIRGAWVGRPGDEQRQLRPMGWPNRSYGALPEGCALGLRRQVVEDLAETLNKQLAKEKRRQVVESVIEGDALPTPDALDKPFGERERTSLLAIIAAMAEEAKIDLSHPSTAASSVVAQLRLMGIKLGKATVEVHLKKAIEASEKLKQ